MNVIIFLNLILGNLVLVRTLFWTRHDAVSGIIGVVMLSLIIISMLWLQRALFQRFHGWITQLVLSFIVACLTAVFLLGALIFIFLLLGQPSFDQGVFEIFAKSAGLGSLLALASYVLWSPFGVLNFFLMRYFLK